MLLFCSVILYRSKAVGKISHMRCLLCDAFSTKGKVVTIAYFYIAISMPLTTLIRELEVSIHLQGFLFPYDNLSLPARFEHRSIRLHRLSFYPHLRKNQMLNIIFHCCNFTRFDTLGAVSKIILLFKN